MSIQRYFGLGYSKASGIQEAIFQAYRDGMLRAAEIANKYGKFEGTGWLIAEAIEREKNERR